MNKAFTTLALFIILTTSAAADPLTDFFGGIFGGQSQTVKGKHRHAKRTISYTNDYSNSDWSGHYAGGSRMVASFYGHGERLSKHTASGAVFNPHAYTAAHKTLPFGTHLRVCHRGCVTVVVNDRFSFVRWGSQCDIILPLRKDLKIQPLIDVDYHVEAGVDKITSFVYNKT